MNRWERAVIWLDRRLTTLAIFVIALVAIFLLSFLVGMARDNNRKADEIKRLGKALIQSNEDAEADRDFLLSVVATLGEQIKEMNVEPDITVEEAQREISSQRPARERARVEGPRTTVVQGTKGDPGDKGDKGDKGEQGEQSPPPPSQPPPSQPPCTTIPSGSCLPLPISIRRE